MSGSGRAASCVVGSPVDGLAQKMARLADRGASADRWRVVVRCGSHAAIIVREGTSSEMFRRPLVWVRLAPLSSVSSRVTFVALANPVGLPFAAVAGVTLPWVADSAWSPLVMSMREHPWLVFGSVMLLPVLAVLVGLVSHGEEEVRAAMRWMEFLGKSGPSRSADYYRE